MLHTIHKQNKAKALEIMYKAFKTNPNIVWLSGGTSKKLQSINRFCLEIAMLYKGAYLSTDEKGIIFFYKSKERLTFFNRLKKGMLYAHFIINGVHKTRFFKIYTLQNKIQKSLPNESFLYCSIIAVAASDKNLDTIIELRDFLYEQSEKLKLPIYVQTSLRRNKILFERYGFKSYLSIQNKDADYTLWLLRRDCKI